MKLRQLITILLFSLLVFSLLAACNLSQPKPVWIFIDGKPNLETPVEWLANNKDQIFAGNAHSIYAIDKATGKEKWHYKTDNQQLTPPVIFKDKLYFGVMYGELQTMDIASQKIVDQYPMKASPECAPILADNILYIGGIDGTMNAINPETMLPIWQFTINHGVIGSVKSPVVANNVIYFTAVDKFLYALDAKSGELMWNYDLGNYGDTPAVGQNLVIAGSQDHKVVALDAAKGEVRWQFQEFNDNKSGSPIYPTIVGNTVLFNYANYNFYGLELTTGKVLWKFKTNGQDQEEALINNNRVFVTDGISIFQINVADGKELWKISPIKDSAANDTILPVSNMLMVDDMLIYGGAQGHVVAVKSK